MFSIAIPPASPRRGHSATMATVNSQPRSETPEKLAVISQEPLDVDTLGPIVQDWTEEEERKARRK